MAMILWKSTSRPKQDEACLDVVFNLRAFPEQLRRAYGVGPGFMPMGNRPYFGIQAVFAHCYLGCQNIGDNVRDEITRRGRPQKSGRR